MPAPKNQARVLGREMRWAWEELNPAPLVANTSAGFQIGSKLYILSGDVQFLGGAGMVPQALVSLDLGSRQWQNETAALPAELAVAHAATMLVGGRHLFIAGGQVRRPWRQGCPGLHSIIGMLCDVSCRQHTSPHGMMRVP
jgi:hypothetical protein